MSARSAIPDVRDQYRSELLDRFNALTRPQKAPWSRGGAPAGKWKKDNSPRGGRFVLHQPASDRTKAVAHTGLDSQWTLGVLQGLLRFPQLIAEHARGDRQAADRRQARARAARRDARRRDDSRRT